MMAFMQYAMQIVFSFLMMSFMFIILPRASVSGDRIADVLETEPAIRDPLKPLTFPQPFKGTVEFRNVSFRYPGAEEDVLHDISFTAQPGQTTAFIGSTGSGKSTVVNLIPRFYDVTRRLDPGGWRGYPRGDPARPAREDRLRPAEEQPVLRHDREQPALCR